MIATSLWKQLKNLVDCDKKTTMLAEEIKDLGKLIQQDLQALEQQAKTYAAQKTLLLDKQKAIHAAELQVNTLKDKEQHKRKQLETAKDQKIYKGLEKEIHSCNTERNELEERLMQWWHDIEILKSATETAKQTHEDQTQRLENDITHKKTTLASCEAALQESVATRINVIKDVPAEWLTRYERMRHSVNDPIVSTVHGSCSACYYAVPFQDLSKLKQGELTICRNCYRFLYYDDQAGQNASTAA